MPIATALQQNQSHVLIVRALQACRKNYDKLSRYYAIDCHQEGRVYPFRCKDGPAQFKCWAGAEKSHSEVSMLQRTTTIIVLVAFGFISLLSPGGSIAADHIVSTGDLHSALQKSVQVKQENLNKIVRVLKSGPGNEALKRAGTDWSKVEKILPQLSDDETAKLAARQIRSRAGLLPGTTGRRLQCC